jgi:hypothetical protein
LKVPQWILSVRCVVSAGTVIRHPWPVAHCFRTRTPVAELDAVPVGAPSLQENEVGELVTWATSSAPPIKAKSLIRLPPLALRVEEWLLAVAAPMPQCAQSAVPAVVRLSVAGFVALNATLSAGCVFCTVLVSRIRKVTVSAERL